MKPLTIVVLAVAAVFGAVDQVWAADQAQVLVLYATRRDAQVAVVGDRELPRRLEQGLPDGLDYYSEYLDLARSPDPAYQASFRDYLRIKYSGVQFDLVIAVMDVALEFVTASRAALFPDTPIVFVSSSMSPPVVPNGTGISAPMRVDTTLEFAAALQPDARDVYVVTGAGPSDAAYERMARTQLRPFEGRFAVTYLTGLRMRDLEARLAALPPQAMVIFVLINQDGAGEKLLPLDALEQVTRAASAPVYSWVDSAMDHGIVGGSLKDQAQQTREVAELALKVLEGGRPADIPVAAPNLYVNQVDWRQLRRFGISESRLPAGTLVRFRELSPWDQYWPYILGAGVIVLAQTALIGGLLVQRRRRRQAEARVRHLGGRLLNAQESERARIARELHDDISQQVALLEIDLELLGGAVDEKAVGMASDALTRAQGIARSMHDLSHRLHPAKLRLIGLVSAIQGLQRELSQSSVVVSFTHDDLPAMPPELTLCLFRIAQEALQNAVKHSGAPGVSVELRCGPAGLTLAVADTGTGFDVKAGWGRGLGLISMRERLEATGGTLRIHSKPGAGTRLEAFVPRRVVDESQPVGV